MSSHLHIRPAWPARGRSSPVGVAAGVLDVGGRSEYSARWLKYMRQAANIDHFLT